MSNIFLEYKKIGSCEESDPSAGHVFTALIFSWASTLFFENWAYLPPPQAKQDFSIKLLLGAVAVYYTVCRDYGR